MTEENPHTEDHTPATEEPVATATYPLASRLSRLLAQLLDGVILMFPLMILVTQSGVLTDQMLQEVQETGVIAMPMQTAFLLGAATVVLYALINFYPLWYFGQSWGKKLMKIAMVDAQQRVPGYSRLVLIRYAPWQFLGQIALFSPLVILDVLFIFRRDRRCIHDLVAGTCVIDVSQA